MTFEQLVYKMLEQMPTTVVLGYVAFKLMQFIEILINRIVGDDDDDGTKN